MNLARVIGRVWATAKHDALEGRRILLVRPLGMDEQPRGEAYLAIDSVDAGAGENVLVVDEGSSAGQVLELDNPPIRAVIVGVVDEIGIARKQM
ncbi:MAG TPA: EutN/CcmL family microcompartment protein [bacterium]|nr:EutN/CcmL family microcompartment protein [bacterium]